MVHYQWVRVDGWRRAERIGTDVPAIAHRTGNRNRTRPGHGTWLKVRPKNTKLRAAPGRLTTFDGYHEGAETALVDL